MTDYVGANPQLLKATIDDLTNNTLKLQTFANGLMTDFSNRRLNTSTLQNIITIGQWMNNSIPGLECIHKLALALDKNPTQQDFVAIPDDAMTSAQADQQAYTDGARLADQIKDKINWTSKPLIPPEVMNELAKHKNDPRFAAGFFSRIGPEKAALFPRWAMAIQGDEDYRRLGKVKPEDIEGWLNIWATSLAAATRYQGPGALSKDYGIKMANSDRWGTSQLLRFDDDRPQPVLDENDRQLVFGREFLVSVGEEFIPFMEDLNRHGRSRTELVPEQPPWMGAKIGTSDADKYNDFMVGYLEALAANPSAAQDIALHRNNNDEYDYLSILTQDMPISPYRDEGDALGQFFEAASTEIRNKGGTESDPLNPLLRSSTL
jgi:hypothetical protein